MEIEIKKCKITKSIIAQVLLATVSDIRNYNVVGWFMYKTGKTNASYILLHRNGNLKKILTPNDVRIHHQQYDMPTVGEFWLVERRTTGFRELRDRFEVEEHAITFLNKLNSIKEEATRKGQFYI